MKRFSLLTRKALESDAPRGADGELARWNEVTSDVLASNFQLTRRLPMNKDITGCPLDVGGFAIARAKDIK